jgi:2-oxoglutarate ferredoxin oxidoreductase subunit delta
MCYNNEEFIFLFEQRGKYKMPKVTFIEERCKGCGLCVNVCPKHIIKMSEQNLNEKGYHPAEVTDMEQCIGCAFCATICPDCVIIVEK